MWKASWVLSHWETHDNQPHQKSHLIISRRLYLLKEWNFVHLLGKKLDYFLLEDFLKYECGLFLKQLWRPPKHKIIVAYRTSNHRFANETIRWSSVPTSRDNRLCHFCSYDMVENEAHFVFEYPLFNPIREKFSSLFENVVLGSL